MPASAIKAARAVFAAACTLAFATGCESEAAAQSRLVPSLVELEPAISCLEVASDQSGVLECLNRHGVSSDYNFPDRPSTAEDFKQQVLMMWATMGRGGGTRLLAKHFDAAIEYAACIEEAANALQGLEIEGDPRNAIGTGQRKAELRCADQPLSMQSIAKRHPGLLTGETGNLPEDELKASMLARIFSGAAYRYVIETNGWVTDEMRPCVRYLDGRPPSPSCKNQPATRAPAPPPGAYND